MFFRQYITKYQNFTNNTHCRNLGVLLDIQEVVEFSKVKFSKILRILISSFSLILCARSSKN